MPRRKYPWEKLSDEQLLKQRLSSLKVAVEDTWLEDCLGTLFEELQARSIRLRPHAWISSEWFSPANVPGIAIPFYLTHPRLMKIEKKMMLDVEGRHLVRVHGHSPSRGRPCRAARLPAAPSPAMAAVVRPVFETLPALLPAQSGQPALCPAPSALVRAEPPG